MAEYEEAPPLLPQELAAALSAASTSSLRILSIRPSLGAGSRSAGPGAGGLGGGGGGGEAVTLVVGGGGEEGSRRRGGGRGGGGGGVEIGDVSIGSGRGGAEVVGRDESVVQMESGRLVRLLPPRPGSRQSIDIEAPPAVDVRAVAAMDGGGGRAAGAAAAAAPTLLMRRSEDPATVATATHAGVQVGARGNASGRGRPRMCSLLKRAVECGCDVCAWQPGAGGTRLTDCFYAVHARRGRRLSLTLGAQTCLVPPRALNNFMGGAPAPNEQQLRHLTLEGQLL